MTKKQFTFIRVVVVILMTIAIDIAVNEGYPFVPPLAMILAASLILLSMRRVKEVTVDERDKKIGGQSARMSFNITATALTALGGSLVAYGIKDPYYYKFGYLLLYVVVFMLVVNIFAFLIYQKRGD